MYILDTSETMEDDAAALCTSTTAVVDRLAAEGLTVSVQVLSISADYSNLVFDCVSGDVSDRVPSRSTTSGGFIQLRPLKNSHWRTIECRGIIWLCANAGGGPCDRAAGSLGAIFT